MALDGRVLFKAKVAASERYNTRLEAELIDRLGLKFADRITAAGKRPVREMRRDARITCCCSGPGGAIGWNCGEGRLAGEFQARARAVHRQQW
ncbi:MAG: hypothetical protein WKF83_07690 [Nocardioidaceae bacterium]